MSYSPWGHKESDMTEQLTLTYYDPAIPLLDMYIVCVCVSLCVCVCVCVLSHVLLFMTPWTIAHQDPLSLGFSRQEYWSGLPFPLPGDLLDSGIEPVSPESPALQADSLPRSDQGSP